MERADQVLALRQVHGGLAADGRVDLRRERGGDLYDREPPHVGGGDEAGQIADHAPTQGHHHVGPVRLLGGELPVQGVGHLERLGLFSLRHRDVDGDEGDAGERGRERLEVRRRHGLVGDHEGLLGARDRGQVAVRLLQDPGPHDHLVLAPGDGDGDANHATTSATAFATVLGSASAGTSWSAAVR